MDLAAKLRNRARVPRRALGRAHAERANDLGAKGFDLPEQERRTCGRFVRLGRPVLRRAALYDIADIDFLAARNRLRRSFYRAAFLPGRQKGVPAGLHRTPGPHRRKPGRFWPNLPRTPGWYGRNEACTWCTRSVHCLSATSSVPPVWQAAAGCDFFPGCLRRVCPVPDTSGLITPKIHRSRSKQSASSWSVLS